jgi:hypothetical protein
MLYFGIPPGETEQFQEFLLAKAAEREIPERGSR